MADSFDPYHVWLGIPPGRRPPTHYELLAISADEQQRAVINAAVTRLSTFVRSFQAGQHSAEATRILNELHAAKLCLLDPAKRAQYDATLASESNAVQQPAPQPTAVFDLAAFSAAAATPAPQRAAPRPRRAKSSNSFPWGWIAPVAAAVVALAIGFVAGRSGRPPVAQSASSAIRADVQHASESSRRGSSSKSTEEVARSATDDLSEEKKAQATPSVTAERVRQAPKPSLPLVNKGSKNTAPSATEDLSDTETERAKPTKASVPASASAPIFRSLKRPETLGANAARLVLWNTHNGYHRDRGTQACTVRLLLGGREVWSKEVADMPWAPGKDRSVTLSLPPDRFDRVRVEITKWKHYGGGFSEIEVLSADGRNLAMGCPIMASGAFERRFGAERIVDGATDSDGAESGYWLLPNEQTGWIELDLSLPRPADLPGITADSLAIWNEHNGPPNNSGTQSCDVTLYRGRKIVWRKEQVETPWAPWADLSAKLELPQSPFDRLRINVTPRKNMSAGLSEVRVLKGNDNLALACPSLASEFSDPGRCENSATDGIVNSSVEHVGYWLLPNHQSGWIEIDLACLDPEYGAACRQLGLACALLDGDWQRGLLWLTRADDPALRRLARADAQDLYDTPEQLAVAEAWWNLAQQAEGKLRNRMLARSLWRYRQALSKLHELHQVQVQSRIDATLPGLPERDFLFFMQESELKTGDQRIREEPVFVAGARSRFGLFMHAVADDSCHAAFSLAKSYRRFRGAAAIGDSANNQTKTALTFRVVGDGRELWKSSPLKASGSSEAFDVDVTGVDKLELFVDCPGPNAFAHSAWVEPRLEK